MRFLKLGSRGKVSLTRDFGDDLPPYAVLSHTWNEDNDEEVTFSDIENKSGTSKAGYTKLLFCGKQAKKDGLEYFWIDTCCINKADHAELPEAITSMFRWYRDAVKCYVYLSDVRARKRDHNGQTKGTWESSFRTSRWFKRGWTLQELIAPRLVEFFSREGEYLGNKSSLEGQIHDITRIPITALRGAPLADFSVDERKRWAGGRETKKKEDRAYCLLGIFNVFIPLMYGEGDHAFTRLEEEIEKRSGEKIATAVVRETELSSLGSSAPPAHVHRIVTRQDNPLFPGRKGLVVNSETATAGISIYPNNRKFREGLRDRNVLLEESQDTDLQVNCINLLAPGGLAETDAEKRLHDRLWDLDQAKCNKDHSEALFQRTLMMSLIARHTLIYSEDPIFGRLDFSVEKLWTCPQMPTRAYWKGESFLTQPKPDLAVCFNRQVLIPDHIWNDMPQATKRLACYERFDESGSSRAFHFLTIEATKSVTLTGDTVGMYQSLNNASQALHNMFEFFREAGPLQEEIFFAKVRFFSVVANPREIAIRVHRATREPADGSGQGRIIPKYPLKFEYKEFCSVKSDDFKRKTILEIFDKILLGYGVKELHVLLQNAAKDIFEKFRKDPAGMLLRGNADFYRYGQSPSR